tara:strand:+ start:620 stop:2131 length:1512 start_codon:yes stop_codon:yes gene_type:complete
MNDFLSALSMISDPGVILALLVGSIGGVIIGAIPGVGPPVAIAIILPATFSMDPLIGLSAMLGIYGSAMYGGALPAILINTPGTAVNALTTFDGYPMTQRGEARQALMLAYTASFVGGVVGVVALMALAPLLAAIAPFFGAREIFLVALLGLILVILVHRGQVAAAGMLAGLGVFMSTVGLDRSTYSQRYTFEQSWLASGFDLIVVVLGLFAFSQAFVLLIAPNEHPDVKPITGRLWSGLGRIFRHMRVALVGSGCGVGMGIIPGVGEFTAQFLSYSHARKTSKTPEQFGKGSPEGLVAAESANNAVPGAALVPLLALGIPGEALTAMMLSVFYVHGVIPGPRLFAEQMDFVLALYLALLVMNVLVLVFLIFSTNTLTHIIRIPSRFLGVGILMLSFVGVYSLRNSVTDCAIAAGIGLFGMILRRLDLPIVPIILGMVLGDIMEQRLKVAAVRIQSPIDLFDRPISAILVILIGALLASAIWSQFRPEKQTNQQGESNEKISG